MDNIARCLVRTVQYLGAQRNDEEYTEEDDLKIVEEVAYTLRDASLEEKTKLIEVARAMGYDDWGRNIGIE